MIVVVLYKKTSVWRAFNFPGVPVAVGEGVGQPKPGREKALLDRLVVVLLLRAFEQGSTAVSVA